MLTIDCTLPPPSREEFAALSEVELIERFAIGVERFDRRVLELDHAALDTAFRPEAGVGRWPCRVLLGHLADAELVFVHRLRRVVAEDGPLLAVWDEEAFIDHGLYGGPEDGPRHPIGAFIAAIHTLRQWTAPWLRTLRPAQWTRRAMHPQRGEQTTRVILELTTWHLEHHAWYLNAKVARLAASA